MRKTGVTSGIEISSIADIPSGTGMGSSSSFTVGLLHCLYAVKRHYVTQDQLAQEACQIEIELLGEPIGKQDQYAAAFGGLNIIHFLANGDVRVEPLYIQHEIFRTLQENLLMFYVETSVKLPISCRSRKMSCRKKIHGVEIHGIAGTGPAIVCIKDAWKNSENLRENWTLKQKPTIRNTTIVDVPGRIRNGASEGSRAQSRRFSLFCEKAAKAIEALGH
jgi:galactokinase/mevalonate kinase-like predicted kinase